MHLGDDILCIIGPIELQAPRDIYKRDARVCRTDTSKTSFDHIMAKSVERVEEMRVM